MAIAETLNKIVKMWNDLQIWAEAECANSIVQPGRPGGSSIYRKIDADRFEIATSEAQTTVIFSLQQMSVFVHTLRFATRATPPDNVYDVARFALGEDGSPRLVFRGTETNPAPLARTILSL